MGVKPAIADTQVLPDASFFNGLNDEISNKGVVMSSTEELLQWARTGSLWPLR
jgi:NADH-quinone oxidoreductase subunit B